MASCGFVTISDSNYFPGVVALVNSIRANSPAPITVLDEGLTADQRDWLGVAGVDVRRAARSIPVNDQRFGCCYALFDIDAAPYDRIVCIDPDAIVLDDIRFLFRWLDDVPIAAASSNLFRTLVDPAYRRKLRHAFPRNRARFIARHPRRILDYLRHRHVALCSGVVAVRRELMGELRAATRRYADFFACFHLPDQDLLSLCVADLGIDCALMPYELNAATLHVPEDAASDESLRRKYRWISRKVEMRLAGGRLDIRRYGDDPNAGLVEQRIQVLHYAGPFKPWNRAVTLRPGFRELWNHYYREATVEAGTPGAFSAA